VTPRINEVVPAFAAKTIQGVLTLTDFTLECKWGLLFPHPREFTPVCTTEFVEFSKRHDYGMVHETVTDTPAGQAVFVIDPENAVPAIIC